MKSPATTPTSSRRKAQDWPYPRHGDFVLALRSASSAWFKSKGFPSHYRMPYCLDRLENWRNNIILPEVSAHITEVKDTCESKRKPFPLHKYAHHGLSSQAMLFNLIGPLVTRNDLSPLTELLKSKGISVTLADSQFEYEDRSVFNEDRGQPTSIDLVLFDKDEKPKVFIECKLVEAEFGGCSVFKKGDCSGRNPAHDLQECFLHFIGRTYWNLIEKYGFKPKLENEKVCVLVNYYQFFRELLLSLEKDGVFVLLYDERSPVFRHTTNGKERGLMPLLMEFVPDGYKERVVLVTVQEVVQRIAISGNHNDWIHEFEFKYGLRYPLTT